MAEVQTSYTDSIAVGFAGMIAKGAGNDNRISRTIENSGGIAFGKVAYRGSADHGAVATQTLAAAGTQQAGNTGTATISATPTVAAPAKLGRYKVIQLVAGATGEVAVFDPNGVQVGSGVVGTQFTIDGITATITTGGSPAVGDTYFVDVTGNDALGITIAHELLGILAGQTVDKYQQYENVAILTGGAPIWVIAGGSVNDGDDVQVDSSGDFVASGGTPLITGGVRWKFDTTGADDALVQIVKR